MIRIRLTLAALLCALLATPALALAQTYVMRHLDTPEGERDPDLTPQGQARAQALVAWFKGKPLTAILVSDFKRTRQTAAPLAAERGVAVIVYDPRDTRALIVLAKAATGPVLIVGHSNTVPAIVEGLGGPRFPDLKHEEFGDIWTVAGGSTEHARLVP